MVHIRPAELNESEILADLACKSEAYWGYDSDFIDKFKAIYKVTNEILRINPTFVVTDNDLNQAMNSNKQKKKVSCGCNFRND